MLRCRDITLMASDYVDGRLRWRKRLSLLVHLLMCPHCRRFVSQFRAVVRVIRGFEPTPPDSDTLNRFESAINKTIEHDPTK
ncbi:MAG: zf-HC2 domain-containing protein [Pseudomonadota bacterium]